MSTRILSHLFPRRQPESSLCIAKGGRTQRLAFCPSSLRIWTSQPRLKLESLRFDELMHSSRKSRTPSRPPRRGPPLGPFYRTLEHKWPLIGWLLASLIDCACAHLVAWLGGRLLRHQELSPQSASQSDLGESKSESKSKSKSKSKSRARARVYAAPFGVRNLRLLKSSVVFRYRVLSRAEGSRLGP